MTKYIGAHVSAAGGVFNAPLNAKAIGAKAFALFTKNQKRWAAKPLIKKDIDKFRKNMEQCGFKTPQVLPHDGYLINLGNPDPEKRDRSLQSFMDEAARCQQLGLDKLNFHPGAHLKGISEEECLDLVAEGMNRTLDKTRGVTLVVETAAGQGTNVGYNFEHLAHLIDQVEDKSRVGICYDTCHTFAAGYDIRDQESYQNTMEKFERIVGFKYLKGVHLNDSKSMFESRVDRHASIGQGNIGLEAFRLLINDSRLDEIPLVLETPDPSIWQEEIQLLYSLNEESNSK